MVEYLPKRKAQSIITMALLWS